jgi:hypothetical protein
MKTSLLFLCLLTVRIASAGNKERNLWSAILINKIEDVEKHLEDGANPDSKNEVRNVLSYQPYHSYQS